MPPEARLKTPPWLRIISQAGGSFEAHVTGVARRPFVVQFQQQSLDCLINGPDGEESRAACIIDEVGGASLDTDARKDACREANQREGLSGCKLPRSSISAIACSLSTA